MGVSSLPDRAPAWCTGKFFLTPHRIASHRIKSDNSTLHNSFSFFIFIS